MKRDALRTFLKGLVVATLPLLGVSGCDGTRLCSHHIAMVVPPVYVGVDGGTITAMDCERTCRAISNCLPDQPITTCRMDFLDGGPSAFIDCTYELPCNVVCGRRPAGLQAPALDTTDPVAAFLARAAHLEAASVPAFERLAAELREHGAPEHLVLAARRAAADEIRHARVMTVLARRYGAETPPVHVDPVGPRSLLEVALENAVEGCVGETWGALVALWQAETAGDPAVRRAMAAIAEDEVEHASLAWAVASWAEGRLTVEERRRVLEVRREAGGALEAGVGVDQRVVEVLGVPAGEKAVELVAEIRRGMWS